MRLPFRKTARSADQIVIIGAGHNGLAAAATLARAGRKVLVLEQAETPGGMAAGFSPLPGVTAPRLAHLMQPIQPQIVQGLDLRLPRLIPLPTLILDPGTAPLRLSPEGRITDLSGAAPAEAAAAEALHRDLRRMAQALAPFLTRTPPPLAGAGVSLESLAEALAMARIGRGLLRLGRRDLREMLRIILSNIGDLLLDHLPDGPLAGALALEGLMGLWAGPRSPGTVLALLYRLAQGPGRSCLPQGGMGAVSAGFAEAARRAGVEIRLQSPVQSLLTDDRGDRIQAVRLGDGATLPAGLVLSSLDPRRTLDLTGPLPFDAEAVRRIRSIRGKGCTAKITLVLDGLPEARGLGRGDLSGRLVLAPSIAALEAAFNPIKYHRLPPVPALEVVIPTLMDPALAEDGRQILSAILHPVPTEPEGGWTDAARQALLEGLLTRLEPWLPGLGGRILWSEVLTPAEITGLSGAHAGHWHHAELMVEQMLSLRPAPGLGRYASGVPGLWFCGAGAHPGGDVTGAPGFNAARQVLAEGAA